MINPNEVIQRGRYAENFLNSKFYQEYFAPLLEQKRLGLVKHLLTLNLDEWDKEVLKLLVSVGQAQFANEIINTLNEWVQDYKKLIKQKGE